MNFETMPFLEKNQPCWIKNNRKGGIRVSAKFSGRNENYCAFTLDDGRYVFIASCGCSPVYATDDNGRSIVAWEFDGVMESEK